MTLESVCKIGVVEHYRLVGVISCQGVEMRRWMNGPIHEVIEQDRIFKW